MACLVVWGRGDGAEVEGGAQLDGLVAAQAFDGVDVDSVVEHGVNEGVSGQFFGQVHGQGSAVDEVAGLARVGVAAAPGEEVAHDHQLGPIRWLGGVGAAGESGHGVGGVRLPPLDAGGLVTRAGGGAGGAPGPPGGQLDAPDEGEPGLGWQGAVEADHAEPVPPVSEEAGLVLAAVQVLDVGVGLAVLSGLVAPRGQVPVAGHWKQGLLGAGCLGLGPGDLLGLGEGQVAGQEGRLGVGAGLQPVGRLQGLARLVGGGAGLVREPRVAIAVAAILFMWSRGVGSLAVMMSR